MCKPGVCPLREHSYGAGRRLGLWNQHPIAEFFLLPLLELTYSAPRPITDAFLSPSHWTQRSLSQVPACTLQASSYLQNNAGSLELLLSPLYP